MELLKSLKYHMGEVIQIATGIIFLTVIITGLIGA